MLELFEPRAGSLSALGNEFHTVGQQWRKFDGRVESTRQRARYEKVLSERTENREESDVRGWPHHFTLLLAKMKKKIQHYAFGGGAINYIKQMTLFNLCKLLLDRGHYKAEYFRSIIAVLLTISS